MCGRDQTPDRALQVCIQCRFADLSMEDTDQYFGHLGVQCSHDIIHNWAHKADTQPTTTVTADQTGPDKKTVHWRCQENCRGYCRSKTTEIVYVCLFLVDTVDCFGPPFAEDGHRFWIGSHGTGTLSNALCMK